MEFVRNNEIQKATQEDIFKLEDYLHTTLPDEYKKFLLELDNQDEPIKSAFYFIGIDGKTQDGAIQYFYNLSEDIDYNLIKTKCYYEDRIPISVLPIAESIGGDQVCIRLDGEDRGAIYYWDHEYELEYYRFKTKENLAKIAQSFDEFILNLEALDYDE